MADASAIRDHMEVIGADGVHIGTVDGVEGNRIKLTKPDSGMGSHAGHHHYIPIALVAEVEGDKVKRPTGVPERREEPDVSSRQPRLMVHCFHSFLGLFRSPC